MDWADFVARILFPVAPQSKVQENEVTVTLYYAAKLYTYTVYILYVTYMYRFCIHVKRHGCYIFNKQHSISYL